jgi:hypothetical protein
LTSLRCRCLVSLDTAIRLSILPESTVLGRLVVLAITTAAGTKATLSRAGGLAAFSASLVGVDLSVGELAGADTLVRLAVLAETVVLCDNC